MRGFLERIGAVWAVAAALIGLASPSMAQSWTMRDVRAGPIWHDLDARERCPAVCGRQGMRWTGQWRTTQVGTMSVCQCAEGAMPAVPASGWVRCAPENGICQVPYPTTVSYGARRSFVNRTVTGAVECSNRVFGDPLPYVVKACFYRVRADAGPPGGAFPGGGPLRWVRCATENGTCQIPFPTRVRYGANGAYAFRDARGPIACSNRVFGDPLVGIVKHCEYLAR